MDNAVQACCTVRYRTRMEQRAWTITYVDTALGLLCAVAVAAAVALAGLPWPTGIAVGAIVLVGPSLARIDLTVRRLPNPLTLPVLALSAVCALANVLAGNWLGPAIAAGCAVLMAIMAFAGGMGMGDVKLGAAIVLAVSATPVAPIIALCASFILGGAAGAVLLARGHRRLPFGPFLLGGLISAFAIDCFIS